MSFTFIFNVTATVVAVYFLVRFGLADLARQNSLVTFREEGKIKYKMIAGVLKYIIMKQRGKKVDQLSGTISDAPADYKPECESKWAWLLEKTFNVVWIGFDPNSVLKYSFSYNRFVRADDVEKYTDDKGKYVEGYKVDSKFSDIAHRTSETDYLSYQQEMPIVATKVETMDRSQIDIRGTVTLIVDNAITPVITLKGDWFNQVNSALKGGISEFSRQFRLKDFGNQPKTWESKDPVLKSPIDIKSKKPLEPGKSLKNCLEDALSSKGITGITILTFNFEDWNVDASILEASLQKDKAQFKAEADLIALGVRVKTIKDVGAARAAAIGARVSEANKTNTNGVEVFKYDSLGNAISTAKPNVLSIGQNNGTNFLVGTENTTPPREKEEKPLKDK